MLEILSLGINIVLAICAVALIVVILVQKTKSGGLGAAFGGDTPSFGARGRAVSRESKLQTITVVLSIIIGVLALALLVVDKFVDAAAADSAKNVSESFLKMLVK